MDWFWKRSKRTDADSVATDSQEVQETQDAPHVEGDACADAVSEAPGDAAHDVRPSTDAPAMGDARALDGDAQGSLGVPSDAPSADIEDQAELDPASDFAFDVEREPEPAFESQDDPESAPAVDPDSELDSDPESTGFFGRMGAGLARTRQRFRERMNILLDRGPDVDEEFWDGLEEALILSDVGGGVAAEVVENLRDAATRQALPDAYAVLDLLNKQIADAFVTSGQEVFGPDPACVLFVGVNGSGKTTTVGKIAKRANEAGRRVVLGSADTFRAAAIEQLEVWARRAKVEVCARERGSDPASVCYDTLERAEELGADLVLIDTAGRLHTSADLMRELDKVAGVVRRRARIPVRIVLVIDATTGQNGLAQAREFDRALDLDGVIVTKLDGTAKGGIALAISRDLGLPILKLGCGEGLDDLKDFDASDYAAGLVGGFDERRSDV